MLQKFIIHQNRPSLLLFFTGWGMDEHPFLHLGTESESDLMICYDYRSLSNFDITMINSYRDIRLVAWSMGVWAASQALEAFDLPITHSIAINGTLHPIDDQYGIPPAIFQGTLNGLNEDTLLKFQRRMCMNSSSYKHFRQRAPHRSVEELKEELAALARQYKTLSPGCKIHWQQAVIGNEDHIFPPANQCKAWENKANSITTLSAAHYDSSLFTLYLNEPSL